MWTTLRQDLSPVIAVASTLLIGLSLLVMVIAAACAGAPKSAPERPEKQHECSDQRRRAEARPWSACAT
jgi:hypothetical protein